MCLRNEILDMDGNTLPKHELVKFEICVAGKYECV